MKLNSEDKRMLEWFQGRVDLYESPNEEVTKKINYLLDFKFPEILIEHLKVMSPIFAFNMGIMHKYVGMRTIENKITSSCHHEDTRLTRRIFEVCFDCGILIKRHIAMTNEQEEEFIERTKEK